MIVKALSHKNSSASGIRRLVRYVCDQDKMQDKYFGRQSLTVKKYLQSYNQERWIQSFKTNDDNRSFNHAKRVVLRHEIISFSPQSNPLISRETLHAFAKYYLENRMLKPTMGFGVVHYDEAPHIHFVLAGVALDGLATRISRQQFKDFKIKLQNFQKERFPELSHSIVDHAKPKTLKLELSHQEQRMKDKRKVSDKELLSQKVMQLTKGCVSLDELEAKLIDQSLRPYYRRGILTGVWLGNRKFRLSTLGVGKEHLKEMTREQKRLNALRKNEVIERNREIER